MRNKVERRKVSVWMLETVANRETEHRISARLINHPASLKIPTKQQDLLTQKKHEDGMKNVLIL